MTFAEQVKSLRLAAGLTQAQYAELSAIPKRTIGNWEDGHREPPEYVQKFIIDDLTKRKESKKNEQTVYNS